MCVSEVPTYRLSDVADLEVLKAAHVEGRADPDRRLLLEVACKGPENPEPPQRTTEKVGDLPIERAVLRVGMVDREGNEPSAEAAECGQHERRQRRDAQR